MGPNARRTSLLLTSAALTGFAAAGFLNQDSILERMTGPKPTPGREAPVAETPPPPIPETTASLRPAPSSAEDAPRVDEGSSRIAPIDDKAPSPPAEASPAAAVPATPDVDLLRRVLEAYRAGDAAQAEGLRQQLADPAALALADWVALRGGVAMSYERIAAFLRDNPDWPVTALLRRRAEEALLFGRKPPAVVREHFAKTPPETGVGKLALALALRAEGDEAGAARLVRDAWREDSFGREIESRMLDAFPSALSAADHRFRMERFLLKENWGSALRAAERAGKEDVLLAKARIAVEEVGKKAEKALAAVPERLRTEPSYLFSKAQFLRRKDKPVEAAKVMASAPREAERLVDGDAWWHERRALVRKLLDAGEAALAYQVARGHGAEADALKIEAEFHAGWIALRFLKSPNAARDHFREAAAVALTPISIARAAYWQGRAAEAAAFPEEATEHYRRAAAQPITYYGQLARERLGLPAGDLRAPPPADPAVREALAALRPVQALRLLYRIGAEDLAIGLSADLAQALPDAALLDALAAESRSPRAVLAIGKAAVQRGLPLDRHAYPSFGVPDFEPTGDPVELAMVYAITRQESAFNPKALSTAGARGLMQLMPATAQRTAKRFGVGFDVKRLTEDPAYNARIGAAHLGELMEDWRGSHILAFASYNAGGGNVSKWVKAYGDPRSPDIDPVDWVERIPFSETRNYVQRVLENLNVYRRALPAAKVADRMPSAVPTLSASAVPPPP